MLSTFFFSVYIFNDPVVASDGITYERTEIEKWLSSHSTSPITKKPMDNKLVCNIFVKKMVVEFLEKNHEKYGEEQYKLSNTYSDNKMKILNCIKNGMYNELMKYTMYDTF